MATWILGICIFGLAGWIVYRQIRKGSGSCDSCDCHCPAKPEIKSRKEP